jgi:putative nucleotidyltransferase with HDIG domain
MAASAAISMKRNKLFGSHLYNQIVIPLLTAALVVGVAATAVAVYFLRDLTSKWVSQVADGATANLVLRYDAYAAEMGRFSRLIASDARLRESLASHDSSETATRIRWLKSTLDYDNLMVLKPDGTVVASAGFAGIAPGSRPLNEAGADALSRVYGPTIVLTHVKGLDTLTAIEPVTLPGGSYLLVTSRLVSDEFLAQLASGTGAAFCFYGPDGRRLACTVSPSIGGRDGADLRRALDSKHTGVDVALDAVRGDRPGIAELKVGNLAYQVWARKVILTGSLSGVNNGYLVGVVSQSVSDQAGRTTTNLITVWSIVAVVALVGLGGWVARRVSDPLADLAEGARRIADGDFTTKMYIGGENEIATLAQTFNDMTDSLRERSESLTKKVLELATLYEMSRALGATLDLDELLGSVLDSALRIFDLDLGYVTLRDKDTGGLELRAVRGRISSSADGAVRSSMSEWVVREGRPLIFNPDTHSEKGQVDSVTGAKAALCVPLISSEGTIGSITVGSSSSSYRFNSDDVRLLSTIANHVTIAVGNIELFISLQEAYLATVRSLAAAVDAKDTFTRGHSERVAAYAMLIGESMGLSHEQRIALEMAAYLHDIGKIGVKEEILLKPGRLDDGEMAQMRHHPLIGANILKPVAFPWAITPVVRHHHEAYDGTGYPAGLKGEEIPLLARILTVADSYEAMTADRPYRAGREPIAALEELRKCAGTQFDPRIVETFCGIVEESERAGGEGLVDVGDEVELEEARAIFGALVDGVFASFRRLGGPRLASNVENELDAFMLDEGMPFRVAHGRVSFTAAPASYDEELEQMRTALRRMDAAIGRLSGSTLVEHFYVDALDGFSARMRMLAKRLDFLAS